MKVFENYDDYLNGFCSDDEYTNQIALLQLSVRNYLLNILEFDNMSFETLPTGFFDLIEKASRKYNFSKADQDNLTHIIDDFENAFRAITKNINEKIVRENKVMPVSKAKEINSASINWLSQKPGETVRQKLSNGYKILAVNRYSSLDTSENRVFKALVLILEEYLANKIEKMPCENVTCQEKELYEDILKFTRLDVINEIGRWQNVAPNNTLLSHKHYKKVWKTWNNLYELDDITMADSGNISERIAFVFFIKMASLMMSSVRFAQDLVEFEYFNFESNIKKPLKFVICDNEKNVTISLKELKVNWRESSKGYYAIAQTKEYGKIMLYQSNFLKEDSFNIDCDIINFELRENPKNIAEYVAISIKEVSGFEEKNQKSQMIEGEISLDLNKISLKIGQNQLELEFDGINLKSKYLSTNITNENFDDTCLNFVKYILKEKFVENKKINYKVKKGELAIVDIFNVRPKMRIDGNKSTLSKNLIGFIEKGNYISIGNSKVIQKRDDIEVISFPKIYNHDEFDKSFYLIEDIKKEVDVNKFVYILPDIFNDFQNMEIHKNVKLNFRNALSVPKSISQVYAWQFSKSSYFKNDFIINNFVVVANEVNGKLYFTLLQGKYDEKLSERAPETQGILWERHPTERYYDKELEIIQQKQYEQSDCPDSRWLTDVLGINNTEEIAIDFGEKWFNSILINKNTYDIDKAFYEFTKSKSKIIGNEEVHLIVASKNLISRKSKYSKEKTTKGCQKYLEIQENIDFPIWIDYIPSLSIKQIYGKFEIMKNQKIEPKLGKIQKLIVENEFTLVKGLEKYEFPLIIGDNTTTPQYQAILKSSVFPLKEDVVCKLEMNYEYGAENAYNLIFKPINNARFTQVEAKWDKIKRYSYQINDLPFPTFPKNKTFEEFQRYPKRNSNETSDLVEWVNNILDKIGKNEHIEIDLKYANFRTARSGKRMCEINIPNYGLTRIIQPENMESIENKIIYAKMEQNIHNPDEFFAKYIKLNYNQYDDIHLLHLQKSLFAFYTMFFNQRKLIDFPTNFKSDVEKGVYKLFEAYKNAKKEENKFFYFNLLSIMGANYSNLICDLAIRELESAGDHKTRIIAINIGNLETEKQKELFYKICDKYKSKESDLVRILANVLWKNEKLIFNINNKVIIHYFLKSLNFLNNEIINLTKNDFNNKSNMRNITAYLEFVLAVFRLRELGDSEINQELSMNKKNIRGLYKNLETLADYLVKNKDDEIRTFVQISVKRSEQYKNIPDLLYALLIYVSGRNADEEIIISGVDENE